MSDLLCLAMSMTQSRSVQVSVTSTLSVPLFDISAAQSVSAPATQNRKDADGGTFVGIIMMLGLVCVGYKLGRLVGSMVTPTPKAAPRS